MKRKLIVAVLSVWGSLVGISTVSAAEKTIEAKAGNVWEPTPNPNGRPNREISPQSSKLKNRDRLKAEVVKLRKEEKICTKMSLVC